MAGTSLLWTTCMGHSAGHTALLALSSFSTLVVTALACGQPCARRLVTGTPGTELGDTGRGAGGVGGSHWHRASPSHGASLLIPILTRPFLLFTFSYFLAHFCTKCLYYPPQQGSDHAGSLPAKPISAPLWLECSGSAASRAPQKTWAGATPHCCRDPAAHRC